MIDFLLSMMLTIMLMIQDWVQSKSFNPISYINSDKLNADQAGEEDEKDDVSNKGDDDKA